MNKKSNIDSFQIDNIRFYNRSIITIPFILILVMITTIFPVSINADSYPIVILSPKSIDFGSVAVEEHSDPQLLMVENDRHATNFLMVTKIKVEGKDANDFSIRNDKLTGKMLETSMSNTVEVVFQPKSAGIKYADLVITNNATYTLELTTTKVPLSGMGIEVAKTNHVWPLILYVVSGLVFVIGLLFLLRVIKRRQRLD